MYERSTTKTRMETAFKMRGENKSIVEIAQEVGRTKSTVFKWLSDAGLYTKMKNCKPTRACSIAAAASMEKKHRKIRDANKALGVAYYLSNKLLASSIAALYFAEGYKRDRNSVSFSNSDSRSILFMYKALSAIADKEIYTVYIQYYEDQNKEELTTFWSNLLGLSVEKISLRLKGNSGGLSGRKNNSQHGVAAIKWNSTYLRSFLQGMMDAWFEDILDLGEA